MLQESVGVRGAAQPIQDQSETVIGHAVVWIAANRFPVAAGRCLELVVPFGPRSTREPGVGMCFRSCRQLSLPAQELRLLLGVQQDAPEQRLGFDLLGVLGDDPLQQFPRFAFLVRQAVQAAPIRYRVAGRRESG